MTQAAVIRRPSVAGYFYPSHPVLLNNLVEELTRSVYGAKPAVAVIVPHGGYGWSGRIAGQALSRVEIPRRCVVLGPSHTGHPLPWSLMAGGAYRTPLGDVPIDAEFAAALRERCPWISDDASAHRGEHSIEVVVPFLQRLGPRAMTLVPLVVGSENEEEFTQLAHVLAELIRGRFDATLLIASSDLSQHESLARGALRDQMLLNDLERMDTASLVQRVKGEATLMCGYGAAVCVLKAAHALGASTVTRVAYGTSAEAGGDPDSVTGYAGLIIT